MLSEQCGTRCPYFRTVQQDNWPKCTDMDRFLCPNIMLTKICASLQETWLMTPPLSSVFAPEFLRKMSIACRKFQYFHKPWTRPALFFGHELFSAGNGLVGAIGWYLLNCQSCDGEKGSFILGVRWLLDVWLRRRTTRKVVNTQQHLWTAQYTMSEHESSCSSWFLTNVTSSNWRLMSSRYHCCRKCYSLERGKGSRGEERIQQERGTFFCKYKCE